MADRAILSDRFFVRSGVTFVMAAEATRIISVPEIVRVRPPTDLQIAEDVAVVDSQHCLTRRVDVMRAVGINLWVLLPVEGDESGGDFPARVILALVID